MRSYKLEINDNAMLIHGLYGTYEAMGDANGSFVVSVIQDTCVNELDADGEEYLVESGQDWAVPVSNLAELNSFIKKCEEEKLWNYMSGPVFRMKPDAEKGIIYVKGQTRNFIIGEHNGQLYIDESQNVKTHNCVQELTDITKTMTKMDSWWSRPSDETMEILKNIRCAVSVTAGGNLRFEYRGKSMQVGQKGDGSFWVNIADGQEKHILYKEAWKDVVELLN